MVEYSTWTAIGYDVAKKKGVTVEGPGTQDENRKLVSVLADIWNDRKDELEDATESRARDIAAMELAVT